MRAAGRGNGLGTLSPRDPPVTEDQLTARLPATAPAQPVTSPLEHQVQLPGTGVNLSCGGARTNHITADPQTPGNAQAQMDIPGGLGADTDYVTLEIGGNDVGFVDVLTECGNPFGD